MTIVSDSDLWMYVSSAHGLTCGRGEAQRCLFPYETDDRLHRAGGQVGPITILRVLLKDGSTVQWRPFHPDRAQNTHRRLYKSELSNRVIFEEENRALGLTFRYQWAPCDAFGFVRTSELHRGAQGPAIERVEVLDGLRAIMPSGVPLATQQRASSLVNAYRRSEVLQDAPRIAVYALSARIVDRAEPSEALRANIVWSAGLDGAQVLLDESQIDRFAQGRPLQAQSELRGRPGAYLLRGFARLQPGESSCWDIVADVDRSQAQVVALLATPDNLQTPQALQAQLDADSAALRERLASADGVQRTGRTVNDVHHLANVLFNCLRGGVFVDDYHAPSYDVRRFFEARNAQVTADHRALLDALPETVDCRDLVKRAAAREDPNLLRIALEYLPLTYSRRHGDPSRPWNAFSIRVREPDGSPHIYYQGNWRDIFQNWEALLYSYPGFLPQVIAKFVNASTADGFNPYRITSDGVDWEAPDPHDPWCHLGYWGDHQIVYLTRLLEAMEAFRPGEISAWMDAPLFSFADVPYRLKRHDEIVEDPRNSIRFDFEHAKAIDRRVRKLGADGRLLTAPDGSVYHATFAEKLLVPVLAKLGQLVLDGGIWMNTQRPEWNDANNALAGYGLSMVTLYQLIRHLKLLGTLFNATHGVHLSAEVGAWLDDTTRVLRDCGAALQQPSIDDQKRREVTDALGRSFEAYRAKVYASGLSSPTKRSMQELKAFCALALDVLEHALKANKRDDGLYHAYNLLTIEPDQDTAQVGAMYEMLEGQVAALSSGVLEPPEAIEVIEALFDSRMYREDQRSFLLYPNRELPRFLQKNVVPATELQDDPLLRRLLDQGCDHLAHRDASGAVRFGADLRHAGDLSEALDQLAQTTGWTQAVSEGREKLLSTYEKTFHHHAFTGRSGTMFGYEGLGSIYWHMVSKLALAVLENRRWAISAGAPRSEVERLTSAYERVRSGLGSSKSAKEYGAFPSDPYSHTPAHAGAQQPGMTGQVKEEILTRLGELGVEIAEGRLGFGPGLLTEDDFRAESGQRRLDFTIARTPITYRLDDRVARPKLVAVIAGAKTELPDLRLDLPLSQRIFDRDGSVDVIELTFSPSDLIQRG